MLDDRFLNEDANVLENLSILANLCQLSSFFMNQEQLSNDDIMRALDYQDSHILAQILENQKLILERLDKLEKIWYNINIGKDT